MDDTPTTELLARLAAPDVDCLDVIAELVRRGEPAAARPLIHRLRARVSPAEDAAILAALARLGTRAVMPMLQHAARARPDLADALTSLHSQMKRQPSPAALAGTPAGFHDVGGGRLALGPRPRVRALPDLRDAGATHLATLLSEAEGARELGEAAVRAGLEWLWLPLRNGDPPASSQVPEILATLDAWIDRLAGGAALYLHCAAGIHRTGMIAHALLRRIGLPSDEARRLLSALRPITAAEVGEHRLAWGERWAPRGP